MDGPLIMRWRWQAGELWQAWARLVSATSRPKRQPTALGHTGCQADRPCFRALHLAGPVVVESREWARVRSGRYTAAASHRQPLGSVS